MASGSVTMAPGDVIAGRYRVDALLGQGGFGVVFRATQLPMGRTVALKMLLAGTLAHADGRARFRREAELAQRLEHPNTVRLYDFGETEDGLPFIAWELLKGRSLDAVLAAEGPLGQARTARVAAQMLKALMEAHGLGIVHRDIKPSNVFLCEFSGERDFVKVLDFGIAKNTFTLGTGLTPEGSILGTPAYMAPEQVQGAGVSPASDLYALGLVMAEMLTGGAVYPGASALEVIMAQLADTPPPIPDAVLASPLGPVIAKATAKLPAKRFASAAEMLQHLEAAAAPEAPGGAATWRDAPSGGAPRSFVPASAATTAVAVVPPVHAAAVAATEYAPAAVRADAVTESSPEAVRADAVTVAASSASISPTSHGVATPDATSAPARTRPATEVRPAPPAATATPPPATVEPAPAAAVAMPPPPAPPHYLPLPAAPPLDAGSKRPIVLAALVGALVIGAAIAAVIVGNAPDRARTGVGKPPATTTPSPAVARRFAHLSNKQIRDRIERAGHRILRADENDPTTTWVLSSTTTQYVAIIRMGDPRAASLVEPGYAKEIGITVRDGSAVLHVHLPHAEASRLLDQIAR